VIGDSLYLAVMTVSRGTLKCSSTRVPMNIGWATCPATLGDRNMQLNSANCEMSEKEAIDRVKNGDLAGLEKLYALHRSRIYSLCLRCTNNAFDAEDLTHDVFLLIARKVKTFRGDSQFISWLYRVALNVVGLNARRQRRRGQVIVANLTDGLLAAVPSHSCNPAQRIAVTQALSSLTAARKETVVLHDINGFSHKEAAWRMGVTVVASKSRLHRAHAVLRTKLGNAPLAASPGT
jgi:RNA polymerase sigma-70 factor, ECF subfamily